MKKILVFTLAVGMMMTISNSALAIDATAAGGWNGATFTDKGNSAIVDINSQHAVTNWTKFNIGKDQTLTNRFNGHNQHVLFKVIGSDPTKINGTWNASGVGAATGRTTLLNPNGVMVGNGAVINLGNLGLNTVDSIAKKAGNVRLEKGAKINGNLEVNAGSIYSAADLLGKSIKLSTVDGINYDAVAGVDNPGLAKGDIHVANSAFTTKDGALHITAGKDIKFENVRVKDAKEVKLTTNKGNINLQAGTKKDGTLDMSKRTGFDNSKVTIQSTSGNIYLENIDNQNGSHLAVLNDSGMIESSNNVNSGNSIYTVSTKSGKVNTTDLHNKGSQYVAKTRTGNIEMLRASNDAGQVNVYTNTGEININEFNNKNGSLLNIEAPDHDYLTPSDFVKETESNINVTDATNDATSKIIAINDKGHINFNRVTNDGSMAFTAKAGSVNLNGGTIRGTIDKSKADIFNFNKTNIVDGAKISELDGAVHFNQVKSNGTVDLKNKNGYVKVTGSTFDKNLNIDSTGDVTIATSTAKEMNAKGNNVKIFDLSENILVNNVEAQTDALLEGKGVNFNTVRAGRDAEVRSYDDGAILTGSKGGDIYAGRKAEVRTGTQDIVLNKVEGDTLHTTFSDDNKVRIHGGQKVVLETSGANAMGFEQTIDDSANNRNFELRAGQFDYAPNTVALKTGVITLDGKRSDMNVKDGESNANTIDINAFQSDNLNIKTSNGDIYVYEPITRAGIDYEAKNGFNVYHIWPGDDLQDLIDNQEINKIKDLNSDVAGLAPSPMIDFIPLGASAEIDEINKKYFIEVVKDDEYEVLQNLPIGTQDPNNKRREIY